MLKIAIVHFSPIELYPPVMNLLNYIQAQNNDQAVLRLFTAHTGTQHKFEPVSNSISIKRIGNFEKKTSIIRYWNYLKFYVATTAALIARKPDIILYYETLSAFPAIFYKKIVDRHCRIFIHFHEYTSPKEYISGMLLNRCQYQLEKKIYPVAEWISHTNEDRRDHFLADNKNISIPNNYILPNYPPTSWAKKKNKRQSPLPLKIIYVGALSMETMFTKEFAEWILAQQGKIEWDVYSSNITSEAKAYLRSADKSLIRFHEGVDYFLLPDILTNYDVGIILYKGHIPTYVYNAPNKLFEYLACGLDVWFPDGLKGSLPYVNTSVFPKVINIDFNNLNKFDWKQAIDHSDLTLEPNKYYCENVFNKLWNKMIGVNIDE